MDDKIVQFRSITNASLETAVHLLEAYDGNLEMAIEYFLQQNDQNDVEIDEQKPSSSAGADSRFGAASVDELVRAPIAAKSATLVEESFHRSYAPLRRARQTDSVFDSFRDFESESRDRESEILARNSGKDPTKDTKRKTLQALFRPPFEIMHRGILESAKTAAVAKGVWLMVNVQKTDEFACQALNRDVWNNSSVQELVKNNFIFWQIYSDTADGQRFETYYRVTNYPFICILDPRTGEQLKVIKTYDQLSFCDFVADFLDENPSFKQHDATRSQHAKTPVDFEPLSLATNGDSSSATATIPKNLTVLAGGLINGGKRRFMKNGDIGDVDKDEVEGPKPKKAFRMDDEDSSSGISTSSSVASSSLLVPQLGDASNGTVEGTLVPFGTPEIRLMLRLPDGGKRFLGACKHTTLQDVLTYAEKEWNLALLSHDFVMNFPLRQLKKEDPKTTLEKLGVQKQDTIYVEEI